MRPNHKIFKAVIFSAGIFFSAYSVIQAQGSFVRGDVNCDGFVDGADIDYLTAYLFKGGPAPPCLDAGDVNDNGGIASSDLTYLVNFLGKAGPPPPPPFTNCGPDPTADALTCTASCCPGNHYKTWRIEPIPLTTRKVGVEDQFMFDSLYLFFIDYLSNPVKKDTFEIVDSLEHLTWYRAVGRDTLLEVDYKNQFESTTVLIDSVKYLLLPTAKINSSPFPESLDHYKAYRIINPVAFDSMPLLMDQFDRIFGSPELIDSLKPVYFLTPALKNMPGWPMFDSITHYVAYEIFPKRFFPITVPTFDQFGSHNLAVDTSKFLLVPTKKLWAMPPPPPPDTGNNHYKGWWYQFQSTNQTVIVDDQFMKDTVQLFGRNYLLNPVQKVVGLDTFDVTDTTEHLTMYAISSTSARDTLLNVKYANQIESTEVRIWRANSLLVPTRKLPHRAPQNLDHYKCYLITSTSPPSPIPWIEKKVQLQDQFDLTPEQVDSLWPWLFCTPCQKNNEPTFDTVTHYLGYAFRPGTSGTNMRTIVNQFDSIQIATVGSDLLLVPTKKIGVSIVAQCSDGLDNDGDGLADFPADCGCTGPSDNSEAPNPATECSNGIDDDGDGLVDLADCGCSNVCDNTEAPNPVTQCNDGIDNDGDGFIDLADLGCSNMCDTSEFPPCSARPGDANASGTYSLADVIATVNYIFNKPGCAPQPLCWLSSLLCRGDWDGSTTVSLSDVIRAVNYIFNKPGGPWNALPSGVCCLP